MRRFVALATQ